MKQILITVLIWLFIQQTFAQELKRKAWMGVICSEKNEALMVDSVISSSTMSVLGIQKFDQLVSINDKSIHTKQDLTVVSNNLVEHDKITIEVVRNKQNVSLSGEIISKPLLQTSWGNISYESLPAAGCVVRTIIYRPIHGNKFPGILFIPGYNCGSIENFNSNFNGKMIEGWVKKGYAVYTVEKSGVGDSYNCKTCMDVDLQTDIDVYNAAFNDLSSRPWINKNQLFIWGHSMGGIIAPIVAQNKPVKGIMVFGTVFRPWSEFLLEMHRVQKPLTDSMSYIQTEDFTRLIQQVYYEFFVLKKSPEELHRNPSFKKIVESELEYKEGKQDMWGRHWRFWQQLDSINLAQAWQRLNCEVLVLHGNSDFIQCSSLEPYLIVEAVNQVHPHHATLKTIDWIDHLMMNSKDFPEAVRNFNDASYMKGNFNNALLKETVRWLGRRE